VRRGPSVEKGRLIKDDPPVRGNQTGEKKGQLMPRVVGQAKSEEGRTAGGGRRKQALSKDIRTRELLETCEQGREAA